MRQKWLINLVCAGLFVAPLAQNAEPTYKPLSRSEKKELKQSAAAIAAAQKEGNYEQIRKFAPGMLNRFGSVMLDPESTELRKAYGSIETAYAVAQTQEQDLTWNERLKGLEGRERLIERDKYVTWLKEQNNDSVFVRQLEMFKTDVTRYAENAPVMEAYSIIKILQNVPASYKEKLLRKAEKNRADIMAQLCNMRKIADLREFARMYPNLFTSDVEALITVLKDKKRSAVLRDPSGRAWADYVRETGDSSVAIREKVRNSVLTKLNTPGEREVRDFEDYMAFFGADEDVVRLYDEFLYKRFKEELTLETAIEYLDACPSGEHRRVVKGWVQELEKHEAFSSDDNDSVVGKAANSQSND